MIGSEKMNYILSMDCKNLLRKQNINLKKAELNDIYESHNFKLVKTDCKEDYHYSLRECKID